MVCLLEEASRPRDVVIFEQMMESFFTVGASRIDLIGKVMDLDNEIGGYNFDIPLLEDTEEAITQLGRAEGKYRHVLTIFQAPPWKPKENWNRNASRNCFSQKMSFMNDALYSLRACVCFQL